jgi:hypothetical protein
MTRVVIFTGPTLSAESGRMLLSHAEFRPPAACGDVLRAVLEGARVIGLVDGYFDHRLSVWHKEILWAMSRGVVVYGAASMGALRAAELAAFGMHGVGEVFEAYARRELEDDDEVAVTHEAADRGYRPTSEAMINLRATLATALREAVLSEKAAERLLARQKARFYPERSLRSLMADATELLPADEAGPLCRWLRERGAINQKLADAEALMRRIAADMAAGHPALHGDALPEFPHTNAWQALLELATASLGASAESRQVRADDAGRAASGPAAAAATFVAMEAAPAAPDIRATLADIERRDAVLHARIWQLALERALAVSLAQRLEHEVDSERVQAEANRVRRELGLLTPAQTSEWLRANDLDVAGFSRLATDAVLATDLAVLVQQAIDSQLGNVLRLLGHYPGASRG